MKELASMGAFIACMYFGFEYNSTWAFIGAVLLFLTLYKELSKCGN